MIEQPQIGLRKREFEREKDFRLISSTPRQLNHFDSSQGQQLFEEREAELIRVNGLKRIGLQRQCYFVYDFPDTATIPAADEVQIGYVILSPFGSMPNRKSKAVFTR